MIIITFLIIMTIVIHLVGILAYGPLLRDKTWLHLLNSNIDKGSDINMFDSTIICFGKLPFTSIHPFTFLFGKYHISGVGIIPYWSKMHKVLKQARREALQQYYK